MQIRKIFRNVLKLSLKLQPSNLGKMFKAMKGTGIIKKLSDTLS